MHVTLVGGFSEAEPSAGGVRGYVESLGRYLDSVGITRLTIMSGPTFETGDRWCMIPVRRAGSTAHFLASLCANVRLLPIPPDSVIHVQRPDELLPFALAGFGRSKVCTLHGNPLQGILEARTRLVGISYAVAERCLLREVQRVMFVDDATATEYRGRYPWLTEISDIIPNAIDTEVFHPTNRTEARRRWGLSGTVLLYAGRLEREKRVVEIVKAFRRIRHKDATLMIAGDGSERKLIEAEAVDLRVRLLGTVTRSEMPSLMSAADALVQYSTREGLPSAVLEALACGTPVIATPVGAIRRVLRDRENGLLVDSIEALVGAMETVCVGGLAASDSISEAAVPYSWMTLGPRLVESYNLAQRSDEVFNSARKG